jgi:hypothetical protein
MKHHKKYIDYLIKYLDEDEYRNLKGGTRDELLNIRKTTRYISQHQSWLDKHKKVYDEYRDRTKKVRMYERELKTGLKELGQYLESKKKVVPSITIYKKDETSKTLKGKPVEVRKKTYRGKKLKKRIVFYGQIRMSLPLTPLGGQKNLYLGTRDVVLKELSKVTGKNHSTISDDGLKRLLQEPLKRSFRNKFKKNWDTETHSFKKDIIPWLMKNPPKG